MMSGLVWIDVFFEEKECRITFLPKIFQCQSRSDEKIIRDHIAQYKMHFYAYKLQYFVKRDLLWTSPPKLRNEEFFKQQDALSFLEYSISRQKRKARACREDSHPSWMLHPAHRSQSNNNNHRAATAHT